MMSDKQSLESGEKPLFKGTVVHHEKYMKRETSVEKTREGISKEPSRQILPDSEREAIRPVSNGVNIEVHNQAMIEASSEGPVGTSPYNEEE